MKSYFILCVSLSFGLSFSLMAQNIELADQYFTDKQYVQAQQEYVKAANHGNVRAYYRLADIYLRGLGRKRDEITAMLWLSLAAEHDYRESKQHLKELSKGLNKEQLAVLDKITEHFVSQKGKSAISQLIEPELLEKKLTNKIKFSDHNIVDVANDVSDSLTGGDLALDSFENIGDVSGDESSEDDSENATVTELYYLVVEYDIAPNGTVRNIETIQVLGRNKDLSKGGFSLASYKFDSPKFENDSVYKVERAYLGAASYNKQFFRESHKTIYLRIKRQAARLKQSESDIDRYFYAKMLLNFPFLTREPGEIDRALMEAIEADIGMAKLEYGLKLYREQSNIKEGIYWITEAAKQGISEAEYRLGRLFIESPWVKYDADKAKFWFASAQEKDHIHATRKIAELAIFDDASSIQDLEMAYQYLMSIYEQQTENPQFFYLLAWASKHSEEVRFEQAIKHLKQAIHLAKFYNWPVVDWQTLLEKWTSGGQVTIKDTKSM